MFSAFFPCYLSTTGSLSSLCIKICSRVILDQALEAFRFDHKLEDTGSAWLEGAKEGGHIEEEQGLWLCGYTKLAAVTMATCLWAGEAS
ncbi:hypothetical protein ARMSODRAFT_963731 [Armillaria solidipes]|uniref:Uncharacterized protein n=1 Tax=Armillaria solidipes TaxID=1076256 RepID=A0A2H3B793_9AGAR|nr:hypothetical protein ARMSODRAFT_963731 [Armillaria solidipes]